MKKKNRVWVVEFQTKRKLWTQFELKHHLQKTEAEKRRKDLMRKLFGIFRVTKYEAVR